jgi:hypothetical protein
MITLDTYFAHTGYRSPHQYLEFSVPKGLGNGGFRFDYPSDSIQIEGRYVCLHITGQFVNMAGPFKNQLYCRIGLSVFPTDNNSSNGYMFACFYRTSFWGKKYSEDAQELVKRLIYMMRDHFRYGLSSKDIDESEKIELRYFENLDNYRCGFTYFYNMMMNL